QGALDGLDFAAQTRVGLDALLDLVDRRQHRGVVLVAEGATEVGVARGGELAGEVHGDRARPGDALVAALALQVAQLDLVVAGHGAQHLVDADLLGGPRNRALERLAGELDVYVAP